MKEKIKHKLQRLPNFSGRDWNEDFSHENGNYICKCCRCKKLFYAHKRRVVCKLCI